MNLTADHFTVKRLGEATIPSPLSFALGHGNEGHFVSDDVRIRYRIEVGSQPHPTDSLSFEEAGPRDHIFFAPAKTTAAIVTCGGLSPGLNNVIRSTYFELTGNYGIQRVLGIRNGYLGLTKGTDRPPFELTEDYVSEIHKLGGTVLGSSRGPQDPAEMVDSLHQLGIDILFCLGGDGTLRGGNVLVEEIARRQLNIAIVGIPKTIDNDIPFVQQSFGYTTALEKAAEVIRSAHVEARGAVDGIGLVKLMGRHAGFIAAGATVVAQQVNFTLVPEVEFPLHGEGGFLASLHRRIENQRHAVVVVAEGAGQHLLNRQSQVTDASGNPLPADIGPHLKELIRSYFADRGRAVAVKYLDPSYHIRSVPADVFDRFLCDQMGRHAVHAAMSGRTGLIIGYEHGRFIHVPIPLVASQNKCLDIRGDLWRAVLQVTGQPDWQP